MRLNVLDEGTPVICVQGWRGGMGHTNTIRVVTAAPDLGFKADN